MFVFFLFKQKTAYELRISDLSSDVCSSDLFAQIIVHVVIKLVVIGVIEPIEPAHLEGTVIGAVAGAETAVIGLHIQAVGRVHGSPYRANRDRKRVVSGKRVSLRVDPGGSRTLEKQPTTQPTQPNRNT